MKTQVRILENSKESLEREWKEEEISRNYVQVERIPREKDVPKYK